MEADPEIVDTPKTPFLQASAIASDIYKCPAVHSKKENNIPKFNNTDNSVPPPTEPPPSDINSIPKFDITKNSVPPPPGPPPSKFADILITCDNDKASAVELQPTTSYLAPPKSMRPKHKHPNGVSDDNHSIVFLNSIRTDIMLNDRRNPLKGLSCLFMIVILIIICCIAMVSAIDNSIMEICVNIGEKQTFAWSFGWMHAVFSSLYDDSECDASCLFQDQSNQQIAALFPIPNTMKYMQNAGYLYISTVVIILFCIVCILIILCERRNSHELLYIKCCNIRIPQRATVYFAFDVINVLTWVCITYYVMLLVYGYMETNFYLTNSISNDSGGWIYFIPHYGFVALICITFPVTFCALSKTNQLDDKFTEKTLQLYYPQHVKKANCATCTINLRYLLRCINAIKMICILSFIMCISFRDCGMIAMMFSQQTTSRSSLSLYFQFEGLSNTDESSIMDNHYLNNLNLLNSNTSVPMNMSTIYPIDYVHNRNLELTFQTLSHYWDWCILIIFLINMIFIGPYLIFVVLKYSSNKCMKSLIICITCVECCTHCVLMAMYYYMYATLFWDYAESGLESELYQVTGSVFNVSWYPDWGILISVLVSYYLMKLIYATCKAM